MTPIEEKYTPSFLYEITGETLIKVQTAEWALHGIVALANKHSKAKSRFKHLTISAFLSDDVKNKSLRKQTLGQIKDFLQAVDFFREDIDKDIESFVENRNTFIHDFYRNHFHQRDITEISPHEYDRMYLFLKHINICSQKWIDFSMGLLAFLVEVKSDLSDEAKQKFKLKYARELEVYLEMSKR